MSRRGHRGMVMPCWRMEDVVEFLSNDGDSEPVYLWRERPVASAPLPASADAGPTRRRRTYCYSKAGRPGHTFEIAEIEKRIGMPLTAENMKTILKAWKAHKAGGALKEHEAGARREPPWSQRHTFS